MDNTEELFNKLLDEHPPEMILGALDEMARRNKVEQITFGNLCQTINKHDENHQP